MSYAQTLWTMSLLLAGVLSGSKRQQCHRPSEKDS